jgi:GT2 family glycosyltransferase
MVLKNKKVGIGIVTCNRPDYLRNLLVSLVPCEQAIDFLVVVNDGKPITNFDLSQGVWIDNDVNLGVGKSKNKALKYLYSKDCDYIFLIEDDMKIIDSTVFEQYINACLITGIQHFNYGPGSPFNRKQTVQSFDLHNRHELEEESEPNPKLVVEYKHCKISLYEHITGTFSFFTREVLDKVGFIDEDYKNAWEHVDHTNRIINNGYHPPFWWFADIYNSHKFIEPQKSAIKNSSTSKNTNEWLANVQQNAELYKQKNGSYPSYTPTTSQQSVINTLKKIKNII